jgi:phospholipase B1
MACTPTGRTTPRPTNARRLLPGDIDLVAAIGDSLTAAFGADATSVINLFNDFRASSFPIGGSGSINTLPNFLLNYNPRVTGFSTGTGNANSAAARLNVAVSGARSYDLTAQVDMLVTKLGSFDPYSWKHIALFIGGNDLCDSCNDRTRFSKANYKANVNGVITGLRSKVRNAFISLIPPPDITLLAELTGGLCGILRPFECGCAKDTYTKSLHPQYVAALNEIQTEWANKETDFHVVVQPYFELIDIPKLPNGRPDMSYFAPDCFHFSRKAHDAASVGLWNNLMEAQGTKKRTWVVGEPIECPKAGQFLQ